MFGCAVFVELISPFDSCRLLYRRLDDTIELIELIEREDVNRASPAQSKTLDACFKVNALLTRRNRAPGWHHVRWIPFACGFNYHVDLTQGPGESPRIQGCFTSSSIQLAVVTVLATLAVCTHPSPPYLTIGNNGMFGCDWPEPRCCL